MFDPTTWYWLADDGRLFSSAAGLCVSESDPAFVAFRARGVAPTRWPQDKTGAQTDAALQEVLAPYGVYVGLDALRGALLARIDTQAEAARARFITTGSGQAMTYQAKAEEAARLLVAGREGASGPTAEDYPLLAAEIGITAPTLCEVAQAVSAAHRAWLAAGARIEAVRLKAKAQIRAAETAEAAEAVVAALDWPAPA